VSSVDAIFSPQRPRLQLNDRKYSPELQRKLSETAALTHSFDGAARVSALWCDFSLCHRTVSRVVEEIGAELVAKRNQTVDDFTHHRQQPEGVDPRHELAVVFVDGGRVQIRNDEWGVELPPGEKKNFWREDKIARLQTMTTRCHSTDPCPELPACFAQPILHGVAAIGTNPTDSGDFPDHLASPAPVKTSAESWQPKPKTRTGVATMEALEGFRWMVQAEAKRRHFFTATRRAFVADGSSGNWSLHAKHFADFVPILDFVHASEYLHAAAKALGVRTADCPWVRDLWQGRAAEVVAALRTELDGRGVGAESLEDQHELHPVQRAWTYLSNASDKLDYPRYRREGLPCTSSLIESQIKEFNTRLKGTEKCWNEEQAEAMLELVNWTLREDGPTLETYFDTRTTSPFRRSATNTLAA
jgi:hypothetical protein